MTTPDPRDEFSYVCPTCLGPLSKRRGGGQRCKRCDGVFTERDGMVDFIDARTLLQLPDLDLAAWHITQLRAEPLYREADPASCATDDRVSVNAFADFLDIDDLRVVDVGSGVWRVPGYISAKRPRAFVGIDPLVPTGTPDFTLLRALGERLPFADRSVDAVVFATSLDHAIDVPSTLTEAKRILVQHGVVYFWGMWVDQPRMHGDLFGAGSLARSAQRAERGDPAGAAVELAARVSEWSAATDRFDGSMVDPFHVRHFDRAAIRELFGAAGLVIERESFAVEDGGIHVFMSFRNTSSQIGLVADRVHVIESAITGGDGMNRGLSASVAALQDEHTAFQADLLPRIERIALDSKHLIAELASLRGRVEAIASTQHGLASHVGRAERTVQEVEQFLRRSPSQRARELVRTTRALPGVAKLAVQGLRNSSSAVAQPITPPAWHSSEQWRLTAEPGGFRPSRKRGARRPLQVLQLSNIANNAYHSAAILNASGHSCDVLSPYYRHVMGCPEWEEVELELPETETFEPDWPALNLASYTRPRWFAQAGTADGAAYLLARRRPSSDPALSPAALWELLPKGIHGFTQMPDAAFHQGGAQSFDIGSVADEMIRLYGKFNPGRRDRLTMDDMPHVLQRFDVVGLGLLEKLLPLYDVVHCNGVDGVVPLVLGHRPYVVLEHGTIRSIPFEDSSIGRWTALSYQAADHVIVTNPDNIRALDKLGVTKFSFVPHPVHAGSVEHGDEPELRAELLSKLDVDHLVLYPARQHWTTERDPSLEKGNDIFFRGLAEFSRRSSVRIGVLCIQWGISIEASKSLIEDLGLSDRVQWLPIMSTPKLMSHMRAVDFVADQFFLGSFGGITPRAISQSKVSLCYVDEEINRWAFPEMPPVANVRDEAEIVAALERLTDGSDYRASLERACRPWYDTYHSEAVVLERLEQIYGSVVDRYR